MKKFIIRFLLLSQICLLINSCRNIEPIEEENPNNGRNIQQTPFTLERPIKISSDSDRVVNFGWLDSMNVFFELEGEEHLWKNFWLDNNQIISSSLIPYPYNNQDMKKISNNYSIFVTNFHVSPRGEKLIFQSSLNYDLVSPQSRDSYTPIIYDLIIYDKKSSELKILINNLTEYCGYLYPPPISWNKLNSMIVFNCSDQESTYSIIFYDLYNNRLYNLNEYYDIIFNQEMLNEEVYECAISPDGKFLVFSSESLNMISILPIEKLDSPKTEIEKFIIRISIPGMTKGIQWSEDNQWIYYFYNNQPSNLQGFHLNYEKINPFTLEKKIVINSDDIKRSLNEINLTNYHNDLFRWRLSPDEKRILLLVYKVESSSAGMWILPLQSYTYRKIEMAKD